MWCKMLNNFLQKHRKSNYDSNNENYTEESKGIGTLIKRIVVGIIIFILVITIGLGSWYSLRENEYAVITTFGSPTTITNSGFHFKLPIIQKKHIVSKAIIGFPIGYTELDDGSMYTVESESLMITKDYNFVNVDFYVEYQVSDPVKYLYASENPKEILKMLAQSYIRDTIGVYNVDDVITTGKNEIQGVIKEKIIKRLELEDIGINLVNITIQDAEPPTEEVLFAFKDVETAKQGKDTALNNANKYVNEVLPKAQADADEIVKKAEGYKQSRINEATGQASRFTDMYKEYLKYPLITKQRMFYETMEDILPDLKVIITDDSGSLQKIYPLESFSNITIPNTNKAGE